MTTATATATEYRVRILADNCDHGGSRDWDNLGRMVTFHRHYNLGDEQPTGSPADWARELAGELVDADDVDLIPDDHITRILDKHVVILPLYLLDHSGLSMSTRGFSCPWDSGQVGYIYCTLAAARDNWGKPGATWDTELTDHKENTLTMREYTERILRGEVETYDQELRGDVYGFILERAETCECCETEELHHVDSCFGFYGSDFEANGMMDHIGDRVTVEQVREAFQNVEYS